MLGHLKIRNSRGHPRFLHGKKLWLCNGGLKMGSNSPKRSRTETKTGFLMFCFKFSPFSSKPKHNISRNLFFYRFLFFCIVVRRMSVHCVSTLHTSMTCNFARGSCVGFGVSVLVVSLLETAGSPK